MIHLHTTRKLFERLPLTDQGQLAPTPRSQWLYDRPALDINPLSGWHGHLITLQRRNCLLLVHDATRFPLFLPALTKPDLAELNDRIEVICPDAPMRSVRTVRTSHAVDVQPKLVGSRQ